MKLLFERAGLAWVSVTHSSVPRKIAMLTLLGAVFIGGGSIHAFPLASCIGEVDNFEFQEVQATPDELADRSGPHRLGPTTYRQVKRAETKAESDQRSCELFVIHTRHQVIRTCLDVGMRKALLFISSRYRHDEPSYVGSLTQEVEFVCYLYKSDVPKAPSKPTKKQTKKISKASP